MHNLHFVVVWAVDGQDACSEAESQIEDWGDGNNWRSFCGAVSEDDEVYISGEGRYPPDDILTIDLINKMVNGWVENGDTWGGGDHIKRHIKGEEVKPYEWWAVQKWAKWMGECAGLRAADITSFDVLEHSLYEEQFGECGVTNMHQDHPDEEGGKRWVVFVDMHD